jgi:ParB/RepB/Spo0J family partition protein
MEHGEVYGRVPLDRIDRPKRPLRDALDPEKLGELADDMARRGLDQPIGVIGSRDTMRYELVWGDRRFHAAKLLLWGDIPARIFPPGTDPLDARAAENLQRETLNELEEAKLVREYEERGASPPEIMRRLGRSRSWVDSRRDLLHFPADLQAAVGAGSLSLAVARALVAIDHDEYRAELVREAITSGASERIVNVWVAHYEADKPRLVGNFITVQQLAQERPTWVLKLPCELCTAEVRPEHSRSLRICLDCFAAILDLVERESSLAQQAAAGQKILERP